MSDKEILAELKQSYEYLTDIRENGCADHCNGQLNRDMIDMLNIAKKNIEDLYFEFYKTLNKEELRVKDLEDDEKVYIARNIDGDYEVGEDLEGMTCAEAGYCWYDNREKKKLNWPFSFYINIEYDKKEQMVWIDVEEGNREKYPCNNREDFMNAVESYFNNYLLYDDTDEIEEDIIQNHKKLSKKEREELLKQIILIKHKWLADDLFQSGQIIKKQLKERKKELKKELETTNDETDTENDLGMM